MKQFSFFHPKSFSLKAFCFTLILVVLISNAFAESKTASVSGNWSSTTTWGGSAVPTAGDDVVINTGIAVSMDVDATCNSVSTGTAAGTAAINGSKSLTTGILTITQGGVNNVDVIFSIGSGTSLVCTSIKSNVGGGNGTVKLSVNGTLKNSGTTSTLSSFTCNTGSTVEYNGTNQAVYATTYNNLILSGSGKKTMQAATIVTGNVTIEEGATLDEAGIQMTLGSGSILTVNGILDFTSSAGLIKTGKDLNATLSMSPNGLIRTADDSGLGPVAGVNASLQYNGTGTWNTTSLSSFGTVEYNRNMTSNPAQTVTPRTYNNLTLSNTGTKTFSGEVTAANLTIKPEASATISTGATVSVGTAFLIESSTTNGKTGSLKVEGTGSLSGSGSKSVQRYLPTNDWHLISSPVSGLTLYSFASANGIQLDEPTQTYDIGPYIEGTDLWDYPVSESGGGTDQFAMAKGYSTERTLGTSSGLATFTGTGIHTGNQTTGLTCGKNGWNCLGNPFTSAIKATGAGTDNLLGANSSKLDPYYAALYFWNNLTGQYDALSNSSTNNYVSVGQGFIVNSINGGGTFAFNTNMQFHQNGAIFKDAEIPWPAVTLKAEAGDFRCTTLINFNEAMTTGLDPTYDAGMFKGNPNIALYSRLVSGDNPVDFSVQSLPPSQTGSYRIPVGLDLPDGGEVSFTAEAMNLSTGNKVILEDVQSQTFTDLGAEGAKYTTVVAAKTRGTGRFYLHTGENSVTAVSSLAKQDFTVFTRDRIITINGEAGESTGFSIYNIEGKQFANLRAQKLNQNTIDATGFPSGVYLLRINNKGRQQVAKLVLMN